MQPEPARAPEGARLVFLHLPKTAGTSLHAALCRHFAPEEVFRATGLDGWAAALEAPQRYRFWSGHMPFGMIALIPPPVFVVTVLRDPVERIVSLYTFWRRHNDPAWPHLRIAMERDLAGFLASPEKPVRQGIDNHMARLLYGTALVTEAGDWSPFAQAADAPRMLTDAEVLAGARRNLLRCDLVGLDADLAGLYRRICAAFGFVPGEDPPRLNTRETGVAVLRPPGPRPAVTPEAAAALDRLTRLDRVLYDLAREIAAGRGPRAEAAALPPIHAEPWALSAGAFIDAAYRAVLGRPPGPRGRAVHAAALVSGNMSAAELLRRMIASPEARDRAAER